MYRIKFLLSAILLLALLVPASAQRLGQVYTGTPMGTGYSISNGALFVPYFSGYSVRAPISLSLWVTYPVATTGAEGTAEFFGAGAPTNGFRIAHEVGDFGSDSMNLKTQMAFNVGHSCGATVPCIRPTLIEDGKPHHICTTLTPNQSFSWMMVDGAVHSPGGLVVGPTTYTPPTSVLYIGRNVPGTTVEGDVAYWGRALTQGECTEIYQRGHAGFALLGGNAPASLSVGLLGYWPLTMTGPNACAGSSPTFCPDLSTNAVAARTDPAATIVVSSPAVNTTVVGTMAINTTCTDTVNVCSEVFRIDGVVVGTTLTAAPYDLTYDTTLLLDGAHTLLVTATNAAGAVATKSVAFTSANGAIIAATYHIATTGLDTNDGLSATVTGGHGPWLTPNHAVHCGDIIEVEPGTYGTNFTYGASKWGAVSACPVFGAAGIYQAKVLCNGSTLTACIVTGPMAPDTPHWAVQGFSACVGSAPGGTFTVLINNYAKNCSTGLGITDYTAVVGLLGYNNAATGGSCFSTISMYEPPNTAGPTDTGTHYFIAGAFIINTRNPADCTDGEGIIMDSWNVVNYFHQISIEQSLLIGNCSSAIEILQNAPLPFGTTLGAPTFIKNITTWGNGLTCGGSGGGQEFLVQGSATNCCITLSKDIFVGTASSILLNTGGPPIPYTFYTVDLQSSNTTASSTYVWNTTGTNYFRNNYGGTSYVITEADPGLSAPAQVTTAPDCSASADVIACTATIRANFVPSGSAASLGYQPPGSCTANPQWPIWLGGGIVPSGLITKPCGQ